MSEMKLSERPFLDKLRPNLRGVFSMLNYGSGGLSNYSREALAVNPRSIFADIITIPQSPKNSAEIIPTILSKTETIDHVRAVDVRLAAILKIHDFLDWTCLYDHVGESLARAAHDFAETEKFIPEFKAVTAWKILLETCKSQPALLRHKSDMSVAVKEICELCHPVLAPDADQKLDLVSLKAATWLHDIGKADTSKLLVKQNRLHESKALADAIKNLPATFLELERACGQDAPDMEFMKGVLEQIALDPDFFTDLKKVLERGNPQEVKRWQPYIEVLEKVWQIRVFDANCPINREKEFRGVIDDHDGMGYERLVNNGIPLEIAQIMLSHHLNYYCDATSDKEVDTEEIKLLSGYLTIADVMNAILCRKNNSHPPRQDRGNIPYVLMELLKNRGTQFDPRPSDLILKNERSTMTALPQIKFDFYPGSGNNYKNHPGGIAGFAERLFDDLENHSLLFDGVAGEQIERAKIAVTRMLVQEFHSQKEDGKNAKSFSLKCEIVVNGYRVIKLGTTNMPPHEIILDWEPLHQSHLLREQSRNCYGDLYRGLHVDLGVGFGDFQSFVPEWSTVKGTIN